MEQAARLLAIAYAQHFGQAPAPTTERQLIRQMLDELNALPPEFAKLNLVNALLVADDVAVPTRDGSLLLWPSESHIAYAIAWGQLAAFAGVDDNAVRFRWRR